MRMKRKRRTDPRERRERAMQPRMRKEDELRVPCLAAR